MRKWGVNMSETNVKRQAQVMGFGGKGELSQDTKTLIRYKILMDQTASSAGAATKDNRL